MAGHNIRNCTNISIGYTLLQVRCKQWNSISQMDLSVLWLWLHRQEIPTLRVILIHKYNTFPKTMSKIKLISIIMDLEFGDIGNGAFWRVYLPIGFTRTATDTNNKQESEILIINIVEYQDLTPEMCFMSNAGLVNILMPLYIAARDARRAVRLSQRRKRINYVIPEVKEEGVEDSVFECSICYEDVDGPRTVKLGCNHKFCCGCIETHISGKTTAITCPLCRGEILSVSMCAVGNESLMSVL
jgi:hypothetical protein